MMFWSFGCRMIRNKGIYLRYKNNLTNKIYLTKKKTSEWQIKLHWRHGPQGKEW